MEPDYSLEALATTFAEHAMIAEEHQQYVNKVFLEQNPEKELPAHMINNFNIARAFSVMCQEITKLKIRCT